MRLGRPALVALAFFAACTSWRLGSQPALPSGAPVSGRSASYRLVPPTGEWVRLPENEETPNVDLSLARRSADAWLNVSVLEERFATADEALAEARRRTEALLRVTRRAESGVVVDGPEGPLPARLGEYCGTFDLEIRARETCFTVLTATYGRAAFVLVGQVRLRDSEPERLAELTRLVRSLRVDGGGSE